MTSSIEITVDLDNDVETALNRLDCAGRPAAGHRVWFAETRPTGSETTPTLLSNRIAIRLRSGDRDELTVELCPCLPAQLAGRWSNSFSAADLRYRIDEIWHGERRVLSAVAVSERPAGSLGAAAELGTDVTALLDRAQRLFLVSCTPPGVAVDHLLLLGPIASMTWAPVRVGDLEVEVERWTIADLDLLELTLRVMPEREESATELRARALDRQRELERALRDRGLRVTSGATVHQRVIAALTSRSSLW